MRAVVLTMTYFAFALPSGVRAEQPRPAPENPTEIVSAAQISSLLVQSCKTDPKCAAITIFNGDRGTVPSAPPRSKTPPSSVELKKQILGAAKR